MSSYTTMNNLEYWCGSADDWLRYARRDTDMMDRAGYLDAKRQFLQAAKMVAFYVKKHEAEVQ